MTWGMLDPLLYLWGHLSRSLHWRLRLGERFLYLHQNTIRHKELEVQEVDWAYRSEACACVMSMPFWPYIAWTGPRESRNAHISWKELIASFFLVTSIGPIILITLYLLFAVAIYRCTLLLYHRPTTDWPVIISTLLRNDPKVSTLQQLSRCDGQVWGNPCLVFGNLPFRGWFPGWFNSIWFWQLETDVGREDNAQEIYRRFLAPGAEESVEIINDEIIEQCKERLHEGSKDVFAACTAVVRGYLAGEPFKEFENSMYFHRYLQWKWLERYVLMP